LQIKEVLVWFETVFSSVVTVAVYVFWKSWPQEKSGSILVAAILLFIPGILKCILKPWDLKRVSINSLVDSSGSEETDRINSLEDFIQNANDYFRRSDDNGASVNAERSELERKKPYDLFVDLSPPYSHRLRCLKNLIRDPYEARRLVQAGLSATFDRLYTKEYVLHQNFNNPRTLLSNCVDLVRVLAGGCCMLAVIVLVPLRQKGAIDTDVGITYILLWCTVDVEYIIPLVVFNRMNPWLGEWPDQVAQYNLIWYLARNKKCKTKMLRKLVATLLVSKDFVDQLWCMTPCKSSGYITDLVHDHLKKGWTGGQITNMATYRAFNDNRGHWTLDRENCRDMEWSLQRPFDESVILWHLATDFCFHLTPPSNTAQLDAYRSRVMSNYMAYLLFVNPEMLMTGARRSLFRKAYGQLKETLKVGAGFSRQGMPPQPDAAEFVCREVAQNIQHAREVARNQDIQHAQGTEDLIIVHDAWKLSENLRKLPTDPNGDSRMWSVIQGVWVEMLCFSAGRCRGYLHAKSLGQGGEYLSYVWLLMSYMGMETLGEKMQRTKLQEEASNSGTTAASTTVIATAGTSKDMAVAIPVPATGGDHGHGGANTPRQRKSRSPEATPVAQQWLLHPGRPQPTGTFGIAGETRAPHTIE